MSQTFSDETLTAFLDGALPPADAEAVAADLEIDADLSERLKALEFDTAALRDGMDALLAEAPVMPDLSGPAEATTGAAWPRRIAGLAALAATLVVGLYLGSSLGPRSESPDWKAYVASYQALYVADTLPELAPNDASRMAQLVRVGDRLGLDLTGLPDVEGLDYRRAQVLGFEDQPLIQIAFLGPEGRPVALCIIADPGAEAEIMQTRAEGMESAAWSDGTFAYYLIGGDDPQFIKSAADTFRSSL